VPIATGNNKDESGASTDLGINTSTYKTFYSEMFTNFSSEFFTLYPANNDTRANSTTNELFRDLNRVGTYLWATNWKAGGAKSDAYTYFFTLPKTQALALTTVLSSGTLSTIFLTPVTRT
jgi:carboxylesterase 2